MRNYFAFSKSENLESYRKELSNQPYYTMMRGFYFFAYAVIFACQSVSAYSEYIYFTGFLSHLLTGVWLMVGSASVALVIEGFKFFLFNILFSALYNVQGRSQFSPIVFAFCLLVSSISITTSIIGGGTLGIDTAKALSTESKHDRAISALRQEITEIQKRNTWRGNTYIQGKEKVLLHAKEDELSKAKNLKENNLKEVETSNKEQELNFRYGFASFEITYILLTLFTYYYKKRSYVEEGLEVTQQVKQPKEYTHIPTPNGQPQRYVQNATNFRIAPYVKQQVKQPPDSSAEITEEVEQAVKQQVKQPKIFQKVCANPDCKKDFETNISNQIYCDFRCQKDFNDKKLAKKTLKLF